MSKIVDMDDRMFSYEYFQDNNVCRLCWSKEEGRDILSTHSEGMPTERELLAKIRDCLDLEFEDNSFPTKACKSCCLKVEEYYQFKYSCQETERRLQEIIRAHKIQNKQTEKLIDVKIENEESCMFLDKKNCNSYDFPVEFIGADSNNGQQNEVLTDNKLDVEINESNCLFNIDSLNAYTDSEYDCPTPEIEESFNEKVLVKKVKKKKLKINLKRGFKSLTSEKSLQKDIAVKIKKKYKQKRSPSYCNICRTDLGSIEQLATHNAINHGIEASNLFKCFGCEKRFKTRKARLAHETNFCKGLKEGYKCGKCDRFLPRRSMYEAHMRDHRENPDVELPESIFQCVKCYKLFKTKLSLKEHMVEHDSLKKHYVCESCGRVFTRQDYLYKHRLTHTGTKHHACPHCPYRTAQKSSLTVHMRKHTGDRPYSCDLCPQRCTSSSNLRAHRRRHLGDKAFECSICMKKFGYKISLEEHVASVHERSQAFPCDICGALYTRSRGLRRHLNAKHGKQKVGKPEPRDGSTNQEVLVPPKDVASSKSENIYLKIIDNVAINKKVAISQNAVYEIKDGDEFVLLNADNGVILTKMY